MSHTETAKKKGGPAVLEFIVTALMIAAILFMLAVYFTFRDSGSTPKLFGYHIFHTHAVNMAPDIPAGTAVFAKESEIDNIGPNSVVLCRIDNTTTLILVVDVLEEESGTFYIVRFKTSPPNETYKIPKESVIGKALFYDEFTGKLLDFATSKTGIVFAVIVPSLVIILMQIIRIIASNSHRELEFEPEGLAFGRNASNTGTGIGTAAAKAAADAYLRIADDTAPEDKIAPPAESREPLIMSPIRAEFDKKSIEPEQSVLAVDKDGRAAYAPRNPSEEILLTGDKLYSSRRKSDMDNIPGYLNEPVKLSSSEAGAVQEKDDIKELLTTAAEDFKPAVSDVLPEEITKLKSLSDPDESARNSGKKSRAESKKAENEPQPPAEFFSLEKDNTQKKSVIPDDEKDHPIISTDSIPKNAVRPREAIAPRKKKNTGKTIDELMSMIDAGQKKIARMSEPVPDELRKLASGGTENKLPKLEKISDIIEEDTAEETPSYEDITTSGETSEAFGAEPLISDDDPIF